MSLYSIICIKLDNLVPYSKKNNKIDTAFCDKLKADGLGNVKPHSYQIFGIQWLMHCWSQRENGGGVILGDEMGLGKTLQVCLYIHGLCFV